MFNLLNLIYTEPGIKCAHFQKPVKWCHRNIVHVAYPLRTSGCKKFAEVISRIIVFVGSLILYPICALYSLVSIPPNLCIKVQCRREAHSPVVPQFVAIAQPPPVHPQPLVSQSVAAPKAPHIPSKNSIQMIDRKPFQEITEENIDPMIIQRQLKEQAERFHLLLQELSEIQGNIEVTEDKLCEWLSLLPLDLSKTKNIVFSKDLGGFGDFSFGFKMLTILKRRFPGIKVSLVSDSPQRALMVNGNSNHHILMPQDIAQLCEISHSIDEDTIAHYISLNKPDMLIVAPVTCISRHVFKEVLSQIPHFFIREYGFDHARGLGEEEDYISGAGRNYKGMIIDEELLTWSKSGKAEDRHLRMQELQQLSGELCRVILGENYSLAAIEAFNKEQELFFGYASIFFKLEFILSVAAMHQKMNSQKTLTFVFPGNSVGIADELQQIRKELDSLSIGMIEIEDIAATGRETIKVNDSNGRTLRLIFAGSLETADFKQLIKASEKEMLTTGDQSWSEGIAAFKHWCQEVIVHKRNALKAVIDLAQKHSPKLHSFLYKSSERIKGDSLYGINHRRWKAQSEVLIQARLDTQIAREWEKLNAFICEKYNIETWLAGMVIKKTLEHRSSKFTSSCADLLSQRSVPAREVVNFLKCIQ